MLISSSEAIVLLLQNCKLPPVNKFHITYDFVEAFFLATVTMITENVTLFPVSIATI